METDKKIGLTFDDVLLVPNASSVLPKDVSLKTKLTKKLPLNIPLVSAAMDTVTESRTAIAMAQQGGIGIIHKNLSIEKQAEKVKKVKNAEFWIITEPVTISPTTTLKEIFETIRAKNVSSFPVVENGKLVGIVTKRDFLFEDNLQKKAKDIMTPKQKIVYVKKMLSLDEAKEILHKHRLEKLPIIDDKGNLKGLITITDIKNREKYPEALRDKHGRLMVGAAIGPAEKDIPRLKALIDAEVDVVIVDTSHGHSKMVVDAVKKIKKEFDIELIAGNVATAQATKDLISAGADAIKVGVGPGAICTTRIISGVGVPQFTAIMDCAKAAEKTKTPIIADGGIKYSGDITKAIAAGASSVMIGSLFAGCEETPGKVVYMYNRKFKQYRGMGSISAMKEGSKDRYFQGDVEEKGKLVPEGIEGIVPYKGNLQEVIYQLLGGVRSGMGLVGAKNIEDLRKKTKWIRITKAGMKESHPHDIIITDEAPNYPRM